ncbi:group II intron maturase-specific domain-containing protein [Streptomyces mirabilis]|uniref:group II intron maturase-specific domain-containing protein n=1 Tax=Streptomyces mirabilis TaxID=68239 RepID=UPI003660B72F
MSARSASSITAVISKLNPVIRGGAAYYRNAVSRRTFKALDNWMWRLTYQWAVRSHPNKSKHWVVNRHFGAFNPSREDCWVFGVRESGRYLQKFSWTKTVRHQIVPGRDSPDDPALAYYWSRQRRRQLPALDRTTLCLLTTQRWRCPICTGLLLHGEHEPQGPEQRG